MALDTTAEVASKPSGRPGPFGRFYLQELISVGGMAEIWLATDKEGRHFALRRLRDASFFNFTERRQFIRGCEILSKIHDHEHVVGYVEHGKIEGAQYLLMDYLEGANLKQLYARSDPVLQEHVAEILIDMALGLEHVHDAGYMHLDFKPENVMVSRNGHVHLVDFDLAQPIAEAPITLSKMPGTPSYMAPEQLQKQPFDHRVDIFSYGVSAFELLTNRKPFPGDHPSEVLRRQLDRSDFVPPRELNPEIPPALERTILKALDLNPDRRHPIMSVLRHEVEEALYLK